ncbi:hypothetical protein FRC05_009423 [Tulasnella sp. 425]|nr:hypothetical protein FRC05_009423 [Tulasnella sp. 425]
MIDLFNTHANDSKAAEAKFRPFKDRVNTYRSEVNNLKTVKSEEEASRHVSTLCERMKGVLKSVGLDASIHKDTKDRYKKAESNKPHFKAVRAPLPGTNLIMSQENPISFDVGISAGPDDIEPEETHTLAFSPLFEDWPLAPLVSYTVAYPTKLEELNTSSCSDPIKCQAWDATYMRTSYENNEDRACWIPLDYHVRKTVKECADEIQEKPDSQIRFISCAARLVVLASYDENDGNQVEKIVDLDQQESQLLEALRVRELRNITPRSTPQGRGKGRAGGEEPPLEENLNEDDQAAVEEERKRFKTRVILRTLEPRSSLLLLGPDPFPAGGQ